MTDSHRADVSAPQPLVFAIAASFTAEPIRPVLSFWGRELGCPIEARFAPYNQVLQTLADPAGEFAQTRHGVNVVLCRLEDLGQYESYSPPALAQLRRNAEELVRHLKVAAAHLPAPILFCLCPPSEGFAADPACTVTQAATEDYLAGALDQTPGLLSISAATIERLYPVDRCYDAEGDRLGRIPYTEQYFAALASLLVRRAQALFMPPYKVIAVDCDNTLWQGICGEDGPAGVALDAPHRHLQQFLLGQREAGMLLTINSKNNEQDVFDTFAAHPEFPLQLEHFTAWRLNWESKAGNLASLAAELNLGLDSFIFLDDNPKECAEVAGGAPEALPLVLPEDLADLPGFLDHIWAFDHAVTTAEDRQRAANMARSLEFGRQARRSASLEEFIAGLGLRVDFQPLAAERLGRVAQLTQRTNQFNSSTIRRSESEIHALLAGATHVCYTAEVSDRFGEYGLVGVLIVERRPAELFVDTFLLSCRALGRGVEHRMLSALAEEALDLGIYTVEVAFRPSAKNQPARQFLASIPFGSSSVSGDTTTYRFPATELQALRWKPEASAAVVATSAAAPPQARGSADYLRIARDLRTPAQILAAIRRQAPGMAVPATGAPPASETEQRLATIWSELLEKPVAGSDASFFDLGGHSLLAVLLLLRIKEDFGVELSVDDVYSGALTLGELARTVEARQLGALDPDEYQALLAEIECLSDEEVRALLEQEERAGGPPA